MFESFRCVKALGEKGAGKLPRPKRGSPASPATQDTAPPGKKQAQASAAGTPAVVAGAEPGGLPEKLGDQPLRLIIVGHNPSDHAWSSGHYYSNPTNWLWRILRETGVAPPEIRGAEDDGLMPAAAGCGFTDVGTGNPGTHSSKFNSQHFDAWRQPFFERLRQHLRSACASAGCTCGRCGAPAVVAFAGKRQFQELFQGAAPRVPAPAKGRPAGQVTGQARAAPLPTNPRFDCTQRGQEQQEEQQEEEQAQAPSTAVGEFSAGAGSEGGGEAAAGAVQPLPPPQQLPQVPGAAALAAGLGVGVPGSSTASSGGLAGPPDAAAAAAAAAVPAVVTAAAAVRFQRQRPASIPVGPQSVLPEGWPFPPSTEVWVMPSTSGAAAMTREQRLGPWRQLAKRLQREPWPRPACAQCGGGVPDCANA